MPNITSAITSNFERSANQFASAGASRLSVAKTWLAPYKTFLKGLLNLCDEIIDDYNGPVLHELISLSV